MYIHPETVHFLRLAEKQKRSQEIAFDYVLLHIPHVILTVAHLTSYCFENSFFAYLQKKIYNASYDFTKAMLLW